MIAFEYLQVLRGEGAFGDALPYSVWLWHTYGIAMEVLNEEGQSLQIYPLPQDVPEPEKKIYAVRSGSCMLDFHFDLLLPKDKYDNPTPLVENQNVLSQSTDNKKKIKKKKKKRRVSRKTPLEKREELLKEYAKLSNTELHNKTHRGKNAHITFGDYQREYKSPHRTNFDPSTKKLLILTPKEITIYKPGDCM
jgi:hypothetical protein